ncbi:PstS family phosphate ABC transporter substrate-binding protein [Synoicihabitans lomoniglobus]|uniref:PBP domain-containing protein n=1 Tax=Synoicihabitans lomoniglobus TaxID=2909285 RepID=A0AAE9ZTU7_9BACT|nr:substrate-binding domain-containing protein [Opitutaceae bacterium LMO-M01]WED63191.1 hypothetical protein PXH66_12715 [Opitutaceae bacterium LMO-M01]
MKICRNLRVRTLRGLRGVGATMAVAALGAETMHWGGSDLLGPSVVTAIESRATADALTVRVDFAGSRPGRDMLLAGNLDIAVLVDDPGADPLPEAYVAVPAGYATAVVVAPRSLKVEQIDFTMIAQLLGTGGHAATMRWGDLGDAGPAAAVPIVPVVTTSADGFAQTLIEHFVLHDQPVRAEVRRFDRTAGALAAVRADDGGLAFVPWLGPGQEEFKALLVAPEPGEVAFGPSPENLHAGDYPLRVALRLVFLRERAPTLLPWLRHWYGDEISAALEASGLVPLPRSARNQQVFDLEVIE